MLKRYRFHYNNSEADSHVIQKAYYEENLPEDEPMFTEHELLTAQDGNYCMADIEAIECGVCEAYFDDGNELDVFPEELGPAD